MFSVDAVKTWPVAGVAAAAEPSIVAEPVFVARRAAAEPSIAVVLQASPAAPSLELSLPVVSRVLLVAVLEVSPVAPASELWPVLVVSEVVPAVALGASLVAPVSEP